MENCIGREWLAADTEQMPVWLYAVRTAYYDHSMIKTFADKTTAALFDDRAVRSIAAPLRRKARRKLLQIDVVEVVKELSVPPRNRLKKLGGGRLGGGREGQWSIRVDAQWRICFRFEAGAAWDVEFCDCH